MPSRPDEGAKPIDIRAAMEVEANRLKKEQEILRLLQFENVPFPADLESSDKETIAMYWQDYLQEPIINLAQAIAREDSAAVNAITREILIHLSNSEGLLTAEQAQLLIDFISAQIESVISTAVEVEELVEDPAEVVSSDEVIHRDPDVQFLVNLGKSRVPKFFQIRTPEGDWVDIDIYKEHYTPEEAQKLSEDFFWLFMEQADIIFDDVAGNKDEHYAVPSKRRLRISGVWDQGSHGFATST